VKEQQHIVNEVYVMRNIEKGQLCSALPYQQPQAAECPEKSKVRTDKKKLLTLRRLTLAQHTCIP